MTGNERLFVTRQNSIKYVIGCFAKILLQNIDVLGGYGISEICGVGSNGFVIKAKSERNSPYATVAVKLLNISYFLRHFYSFEGDNYHAFAFDHLEEIEESLLNLSIKSVQVVSSYEDTFNDAELCAFRREFYALSRIPRNNNVAFLVDHGFLKIHLSDNRRFATYIFPFLVMPYFSGISLTDYASSCKLNIKKTIEISIQMAGLIELIHNCGVVHRDLYPNNFIYNEEGNSLSLIDFGSAIAMNEGSMDTPGERRGARRFMSPEQFIDATTCDPMSDIYFLGADMFYLFSGDTPYDRTRDGMTSPKNIYDIINCQGDPQLSYFLCLINRMIHPERNHRMGDINVFKAEIAHMYNFL